jgi:hypothetical protein
MSSGQCASSASWISESKLEKAKAAMLFQAAANKLGTSIPIDGVLGPATQQFINTTDPALRSREGVSENRVYSERSPIPDRLDQSVAEVFPGRPQNRLP